MDNVILNQKRHLKCFLVLVCAMAYSKTNDNRSYGQAKVC